MLRERGFASFQQQTTNSPLKHQCHPPPLTTRHIWYRLVNADSQPYKGSNTFSVAVASGSLVDHLRDAVLVKCFSLPRITSAQLVVYKNMAAFDKRTAATDAVDEMSVLPLEDDAIVDDSWGTSAKEALIVVVPSSTFRHIHQRHRKGAASQAKTTM